MEATTMKNTLLKAFCLFCAVVIGSTAYAAAPGYHIIKKIQIGGEGGWDYPSIDSKARRLYVSRSTHVIVIDIDKDKIVGDIPDTPGVHGIAIASELGRGFISCGKSDTAVIFDLKTLKIIGQVKTGTNPDAILYEPAYKKVYTFNGKSNDATVFDAVSGKINAVIALGGKPEFAAADKKGKVYVNIEDTAEVAEIDGRSLSVSRRFSLKPCEEPTGMGLDIENHHVFSGCHNKVMTVLDVSKGKLIAVVPIGSGVDGNGFDRETGLAFSANGEGTLTVVAQSAPGRFEVAQIVPTQRGARTMAIDTKTHNIYLPAAEFAEMPEPTIENPKPKPVQIKDSFVILVIGK
jgi:DNA-binding beta-propeller fold protein YncE